ncbi:MAG: hypothetical protein ACRD3B_14730 [Candidatus Sulfotelmatobacter sp.]
MIVSRRIVEGTEQFLTLNWVWAHIHQFVHKSMHSFIVSDGKFMRMTSHD